MEVNKGQAVLMGGLLVGGIVLFLEPWNMAKKTNTEPATTEVAVETEVQAEVQGAGALEVSDQSGAEEDSDDMLMLEKDVEEVNKSDYIYKSEYIYE